MLIGELPRRRPRAGLISAALLAAGAGSLVLALGFVLVAPMLSSSFAAFAGTPARAALFTAGVVVTAVSMVFDLATIGLLRLHTVDDADADAMLARVQNDLFDVGADLCVPGAMGERLRVTDAPSLRMEAEVVAMNAALAPLTSFVLPGGTPAAAMAHLARTTTRRAERLVVALAAEEALNPEAVRYLNRLSDLLFVMSRRLNGHGAGDVLWVPGATR